MIFKNYGLVANFIFTTSSFGILYFFYYEFSNQGNISLKVEKGDEIDLILDKIKSSGFKKKINDQTPIKLISFDSKNEDRNKNLEPDI